MTRARASKQPDFLGALIRTAYIPLEVPPVITSRYFSRFCKENYAYLKGQKSSLIKLSTNYETFTAPRPISGRRNLALVHPLAQLCISLLLTQHRSRIKKIISKSSTSLYRTSEDMRISKAFAGLDFESWEMRKYQLFSEYSYVLKADISRFFYTAYTHSIPWAVLGKEKAKDLLAHNKTKLLNHWSSDFDKALQSCQSRETFGIPVGPDTSRVIAEILLAGVENDKDYAPLVKYKHGIRLVDDFLIGFHDENEAQKTLVALRRVLWKFNLQLNDEKTSISDSRKQYKDAWRLTFDEVSISDDEAKKQKNEILHLVDLTCHLCSEHNTNLPAHWACVRLSRIKIQRGNFRTVLDAMLRLARDFPSCSHLAAAFLINNKSRCHDSYAKKRIQAWVQATIRNNLGHSHEFEISWCMLISGVYKMVLDRSCFASFEPVPSPAVFAILGLLNERKLLPVPLSKWAWRSTFKKSGVYGENWLPLYESVRRGWTKDRQIVSEVKRHPILNLMLNEDVTFLEDQIFDAASIDVSKRYFRKNTSYKKSKQSSTEKVKLASRQVENDDIEWVQRWRYDL